MCGHQKRIWASGDRQLLRMVLPARGHENQKSRKLKKNQKPEFFKVNQKFKKYSKSNRKYGEPPLFSETLDFFLNIF